MNKAAEVPAEKLKYLALVLALGSIGCCIASIIVSGFAYFGAIGFVVAPVLLNVFIIFVKDEQKTQWAQHNIGYILLYLFFGLWTLSGVYQVIMWILNLTVIFQSLITILAFAQLCTYTLDGLVGLVYYHNFRTGVISQNSGEPLINSA